MIRSGVCPARAKNCPIVRAARRPLPGGTFPEGGLDALVDALARQVPAIEPRVLTALARRHGSLAREVLAGAPADSVRSRRFGADLYAFEVDYLVRREWARSADDVAWRRTKSGLRLEAEARERLAEYLRERACVGRVEPGEQ